MKSAKFQITWMLKLEKQICQLKTHVRERCYKLQIILDYTQKIEPKTKWTFFKVNIEEILDEFHQNISYVA